MVEYPLHRPVGRDGNIFRIHEAANRVFRIAKKRLRHGSFRGRQQLNHLSHNRPGKLFEECRSVIGRHLIQHAGNLFPPHRLQDGFLNLNIKVFEYVSSPRFGKQAKNESLLVFMEIRNDIGKFAGMPVFEKIFQCRKIPRLDQVVNFRKNRPSKHSVFPLYRE